LSRSTSIETAAGASAEIRADHLLDRDFRRCNGLVPELRVLTARKLAEPMFRAVITTSVISTSMIG